MIYYGLQKAFGAFHGLGFQNQLDWFSEHLHVPTWIGALAIISEFGGSIAVLLGLFTRLGALGIVCTMAVAAYTGASRPGVLHGLLTGDYSAPPAVLYPLAMMFMALAVVFTGAGSFSLDAKIFKRGKK